MKDVRMKFIIDGKIRTREYTLEEVLRTNEKDILLDAEVCDCNPTKSNPKGICVGDCYRFDNSIITGVRMCTNYPAKNRKLIYDGDILFSQSLRGGNDSKYMQKPKSIYHVVKWSQVGYVAEGYNGEMIVRPELAFRADWKIVGNIDENPELL